MQACRRRQLDEHVDLGQTAVVCAGAALGKDAINVINSAARPSLRHAFAGCMRQWQRA